MTVETLGECVDSTDVLSALIYTVPDLFGVCTNCGREAVGIWAIDPGSKSEADLCGVCIGNEVQLRARREAWATRKRNVAGGVVVPG